MSQRKQFLTTKDIHVAVRYWQVCLSRLNTKSREDVAYDMVDITCNDNCDDWFKADKDFDYVFELASMLELPGDIYIPQIDRPAAWQELKRRMKTLEECYLKE